MFTKMINNKKHDRTIEVPVSKNGRIKVDSKGFVHLRHPYNHHDSLAVSIIKEQFHSEASHIARSN